MRGAIGAWTVVVEAKDRVEEIREGRHRRCSSGAIVWALSRICAAGIHGMWMVAVRRCRWVIRIGDGWPGQNRCHRLAAHRSSTCHVWLLSVPSAHQLHVGVHVPHRRQAGDSHTDRADCAHHTYSVHQTMNRGELARVNAAPHAGVVPFVGLAIPSIVSGVGGAWIVVVSPGRAAPAHQSAKPPRHVRRQGK